MENFNLSKKGDDGIMLTMEEFFRILNKHPQHDAVLWSLIEPHLKKDIQPEVATKMFLEFAKNKKASKKMLTKEEFLKECCKTSHHELWYFIEPYLRGDAYSELQKENEELRRTLREAISQNDELKAAETHRNWLKSREYWIRYYAGLALQGVVSEGFQIGADLDSKWFVKQAEKLCGELGIE